MPEVPSAAITTIIGITLGSTWRAISRAGEPPSARAAVTKSRSAIDSVSARTTRAICVHETRPITSSTLSRLGRSTATNAIASSNAGSVSITSVKRIRTKSAAPPKKPETEPDRHPDRHRDHHRGDADDERDARAPDDAREHVAAQLVGAERKGGRRPAGIAVSRRDRAGRIVRREQRREQRGQHQAQHHRRAHQLPSR